MRRMTPLVLTGALALQLPGCATMQDGSSSNTQQGALAGAVIGCLAYAARTLTQLGLASEPKGWTLDAHAGH